MSPVDGLPDRPLSLAEAHRLAASIAAKLGTSVVVGFDDRGRVPALVLVGVADVDALVFDEDERRWRLLEEWSADQDDRDLELAEDGGLPA